MNKTDGDPHLPLSVSACENPHDRTRDLDPPPPKSSEATEQPRFSVAPHDGQPVVAGDPITYGPNRRPPSRRVRGRSFGWRDREGSLDAVRPDKSYFSTATVMDASSDEGSHVVPLRPSDPPGNEKT
jgi:hypothetical protein